MVESGNETFWKSKVERDRDESKSLVPLDLNKFFQISNIFGRNQAQDFWKDKQTDETKTYQ